MTGTAGTRAGELALVAGALVVLLAFGIFTTPLYGLDEIWVYQLSRRLAHGYTPYRDFYLIIFPLSVQVNAVALALIADQLLVLRSVALVVSTGTALLIYLICRRIGVARPLCLLPLAAFVWAAFISPYNSYTWFALAFLSAALLTDLVLLQRASVHDASRGRTWPLALVTGVLLGLAALSKQHIGLAGLAASIAFTLIAGPRDARRDVRRAGLILLGFLAVVGAELVWLWSVGALGPFLRYTVFEALTFGSEAGTPYMSLMRVPLGVVVGILVPTALVCSLGWGLRKALRDGNCVLLLVSFYAIAGFVVVFPRSDLPHLFVAAPLALIGVSHWLSDQLRGLKFKLAELIVVFPLLLVLLAPLVRSQENIGALLRGDIRFSAQSRYVGVPISPGLDAMISQVGDALRRLELEGRRVYFLEHAAALFLIPMDRFAERFDVPLAGNFGAHGVEEAVRGLADDPMAVALIRPGSHPLEPREIIDYVQATMTRAGQIAGYELYVR